ncbi:MAG TPA: DUF6438 domain-containing protein [Xanthomonadales bacterium]|nr:DUF6438 domain-containing protein [Xanthomonadales bacterium]
MRLLAVAAALIVSLAACGGLRHAPPENTGLGSITSIAMQKTACYGTCPAYLVRFMADGRARYTGGMYAPLQGHFSGNIDFAALAAWIATQHPETLPDTHPTVNIDAPGVNLQIEYGARRVRFTGISESSASLRLEGILLALDGATSRIRWRRDDPATAFLGTFRGAVTLTIGEDSSGTFFAYGSPTGCGMHGYRAKVERGALRLHCSGRTTVLRIAGDDLQAEGDAVPPGRYARVNPYATSRDRLWYGPDRPSE